MTKILTEHNSKILFDDSTILFFIKDNIHTIWRELHYIKTQIAGTRQVMLSIHMMKYPVIQQLLIQPLGKMIVINPNDYFDISSLLDDINRALDEIHPE